MITSILGPVSTSYKWPSTQGRSVGWGPCQVGWREDGTRLAAVDTRHSDLECLVQLFHHLYTWLSGLFLFKYLFLWKPIQGTSFLPNSLIMWSDKEFSSRNSGVSTSWCLGTLDIGAIPRADGHHSVSSHTGQTCENVWQADSDFPEFYQCPRLPSVSAYTSHVKFRHMCLVGSDSDFPYSCQCPYNMRGIGACQVDSDLLNSYECPHTLDRYPAGWQWSLCLLSVPTYVRHRCPAGWQWPLCLPSAVALPLIWYWPWWVNRNPCEVNVRRLYNKYGGGPANLCSNCLREFMPFWYQNTTKTHIAGNS